jgi:hypothetical protein
VQRLKPVILAAVEVEIGRMVVQGQFGREVISTNISCVWWCAPVIPYTGSINRKITVQARQA